MEQTGGDSEASTLSISVLSDKLKIITLDGAHRIPVNGSFSDEVFDFPPSDMIGKLNLLKSQSIRKIYLPARTRFTSVFCDERNYHVYKWDVKNMKQLRNDSCTFLFRLLQVIIMKLESLGDEVSFLPLGMRDVYYHLLNEMGIKGVSQEKIALMIDDVCCYFQCSRKSLGLTSESHGFYIGNIIVVREDKFSGGEVEEDGSSLIQAFSINFTNIKNIKSHRTKPKPLFILVVEKLTVFSQIISHRLHHTFPCVIITGMGMPSLDCRMFVKKVSNTLKVPVFALVDINPYGCEIYKTFKYGSLAMSFMSRNLLTLNMKIIGVFRSDLEMCGLSPDDMQSISNFDKNKLTEQLTECWTDQEPDIKASLQSILDDGKKADIEIIAVKKTYEYFVTNFLKGKIKEFLSYHGA